MNLSIFKDRKITLGLISSFIASLIAVFIAAVTGSDFWVVFVILASVLLSYSVVRADEVYSTKGSIDS